MSKAIFDFAELGRSIGELVAKKNAAYGSSFEKCDVFLTLLYPDGLKPEQYQDALLVVRIFDKLMRIATAKDALGEDPYRDIAGYGMLGASVHLRELYPDDVAPLDNKAMDLAKGIYNLAFHGARCADERHLVEACAALRGIHDLAQELVLEIRPEGGAQ